MDLQLEGRRALVTGGTRGIGRAVVKALLAEGADVAFCARDAEAVERTVAELSGGPRVTGRALDVADEAALTAWVGDTAAELGGLDVVVANVSALAIPDTPQSWQASFEVDLMGTVRLVHAALPHLHASGVGSVVAISSVSGREVDFAAGPYGTLKAALVHYISGLAFQQAGTVRANTVSPGNVLFEGGVWGTIQRDQPDFFAQVLALNPTGRMATPQEIAAAVVFLSSPVSSFTTGAHLVVDGALTRGVQL